MPDRRLGRTATISKRGNERPSNDDLAGGARRHGVAADEDGVGVQKKPATEAAAKTQTKHPVLNSDYRDILSAFADAEVEYLLVGAHALAAHGHPRATGDIDLWVKPSAGNAARVMQALRQFGAPLRQVSRNTSPSRTWYSRSASPHAAST